KPLEVASFTPKHHGDVTRRRAPCTGPLHDSCIVIEAVVTDADFPKNLIETAAHAMQCGFDITAGITVTAAAAGHAVQFRAAEKIAHLLAACGIDELIGCYEREQLCYLASCRAEVRFRPCRRRPRGTGAGGPRGCSFGLSRIGAVAGAIGDPVPRYVSVVSRDP